MPKVRDLKKEAAAKKKLLAFLTKLLKAKKGCKAYIETWSDGPWGFRIAEIGILSGFGGETYYRMDAGNSVLFRICEDLFNQWAYEVGPASDIVAFKGQLRKWMKNQFIIISTRGGREQALPNIFANFDDAWEELKARREDKFYTGMRFEVRCLEAQY